MEPTRLLEMTLQERLQARSASLHWALLRFAAWPRSPALRRLAPVRLEKVRFALPVE
jgi:hypothetical protein